LKKKNKKIFFDAHFLKAIEIFIYASKNIFFALLDDNDK